MAGNERGITADEVLTTTRAVRKRLDFERPVPRELLLECIEIAVQAPSASNTQHWHFVAVSDPERKRALADLYRQSFSTYASRRPAQAEPPTEGQLRLYASAQYLADRYHEAPWLVIPVLQGRPSENAPVVEQASFWGSILPAFWSFMLAARARGLGTALTTLHLAYEREAADVLGIPYAEYTQAGMTPVAYFTGESFKPAERLPLESVMHWDGW
jgi:nitroreductase